MKKYVLIVTLLAFNTVTIDASGNSFDRQLQEVILFAGSDNSTVSDLLHKKLNLYPLEKLYTLVHSIERIDPVNLNPKAQISIYTFPTYQIALKQHKKLNTNSIKNINSALHIIQQELMDYDLRDKTIALVSLYFYLIQNEKCNGIIDTRTNTYYSMQGKERLISENDKISLQMNSKKDQRYYFLEQRTILHSLPDLY